MTEILALDPAAELGGEIMLAPAAEQLVEEFRAELAELDTIPSEEVERVNRITMGKESGGTDWIRSHI